MAESADAEGASSAEPGSGTGDPAVTQPPVSQPPVTRPAATQVGDTRAAGSETSGETVSGGKGGPAGEEQEQRPAEQGSIGRLVDVSTDAAVGYGMAAAKAAVGMATGLGRAGAGIARNVIDNSPVGAAAERAADRIEPLAAKGRTQRRATAEEVRAVVEQVVERVATRVVDEVNIDGIVQGVDIDEIIKRVDIDDIVKRVDVDDVVQRVDIDEIVQRVDIDGIVSGSEIGSLVVSSTAGTATQVLDSVRSQGVGLDTVATRLADRILRRDRPRPQSPPLLTELSEDDGDERSDAPGGGTDGS